MDMQDHNFEMVYFNSTRDKPKLGYRGFVYQKDKNRGETTHWKHERREDCNGRLLTKEGKVTKKRPLIIHLMHQWLGYNSLSPQ